MPAACGPRLLSGVMMGLELWLALALVLVLEGVLPALSPATYRKVMLSIAQMDNRAIRSGGLVLMVVGAVLVYWLRH